MNIPPILERLLLSNEAVFKNASLGLTGENMVYVPPGKTAVLLEVSIEPFVNDISVNPLFTEGIGNEYKATFISLIKRILFQLQIINDSYSTYFTFHECFTIKANQGAEIAQSLMDLHFKGIKEELFIYTDRSMYFNILYPYQYNEIGADTTGITPIWDTPVNDFIPLIQTLPKSPISFNNNAFINFLDKALINSPALDAYFPVNQQTQGNNQSQMEYLRFFAASNKSSVEQPHFTGTELEFGDLFRLPMINVKYALLNKRPDDYGIVAPKNL